MDKIRGKGSGSSNTHQATLYATQFSSPSLKLKNTAGEVKYAIMSPGLSSTEINLKVNNVNYHFSDTYNFLIGTNSNKLIKYDSAGQVITGEFTIPNKPNGTSGDCKWKFIKKIRNDLILTDDSGSDFSILIINVVTNQVKIFHKPSSLYGFAYYGFGAENISNTMKTQVITYSRNWDGGTPDTLILYTTTDTYINGNLFICPNKGIYQNNHNIQTINNIVDNKYFWSGTHWMIRCTLLDFSGNVPKIFSYDINQNNLTNMNILVANDMWHLSHLSEIGLTNWIFCYASNAIAGHPAGFKLATRLDKAHGTNGTNYTVYLDLPSNDYTNLTSVTGALYQGINLYGTF